MRRDLFQDGEINTKKEEEQILFEKINSKYSSEASDDMKSLLLRLAKREFWKA